jgi:hypothetical protein
VSQRVALIFFVCFIGVSAFAKVDLVKTKKMNIPKDVSQSNSAFYDVSNKLNKSLTEADNSRTIVSKVIDNTLSYWWDNSGFKNTSMGQAVETVEKKMKADVNLGSTTTSDVGKKIEHKLSIKLLAAQAMAKIEYLGWFKGAVQYNARNAATEAEVLENLSNNKDLVISHSVTTNESKSQVSLRWNW